MDVPYACSEDSNGLSQHSCNQSHGEAKYYSSHTLVFNTPNPYEETDISGDSCKNFKISWADPPVEIHEECTTDIDLPLLMWHGYDVPPKVLSVCNTGRTITVNGQWTSGRPHLEGGPLNGKYIFSQIHFHCPSEHEIDGRRYPMEMHVVHYKASYLTQERAMHEKDGTLVLSYLFQVVEAEETILSQITKTKECLKEINSRIEITRIPLCELVTPFYCNYYVYWGSVSMKKNSFILQWIINCNQSQVTKEEVCIREGNFERRVDTLLCVMNTCAVMMGQGPKMRPQNSLIYRVGENYDIRTPTQTTETCPSAQSVCEQDPATGQESICPNAGPYYNLQQYSQCLTCSARSAERVCSLTQPHGTCQSETQNVCWTCGGIPAPPPSHPCQCKPNYQKVCKSCGGSRSRIVWCKKKWDKCKSKCSVRSKISPCSSSERRCKKCLRKRKCVRKKCRSKTSSCTSCSEKSDPENLSCRRSSSPVCRERKSSMRTCPAEKTVCAVKKPTVEECPPENLCELLPPEEPLEKSTDATLDDSCGVPSEKPSSTSCSCTVSSTPCTSTSDVCRRRKKRQKPKKKRCRRTVCYKHQQKVNSKKEDCDDQNDEKVEQKKEVKKKDAKENNNESKECSTNGKSENGETSKSGKKPKGKKSKETSEKSSEKGEAKKTKKQKDDEVTTLFVKIPETVFPQDNTNALSCSDSGLEEKKNMEAEKPIFVNQESYVVKKVTRTEGEETGLPWSELCFQMKHSFQVKKTDSFCLPQEYQVSLVCDNNVLQEYRGQFRPQDISLNSFEELPLAPKYLKPDESKVRLEECVIKKLSTDKFCIDSKFLLRSWNPKHAILNTEKDTADHHYSEKLLNSFFDAGTQCSVEELELNEIPLTDVKSESVQTDESYLPVNDKVEKIPCKKLDVKSQTVQTEQRRDVEKEKKELLRQRAKILKTISTPELSALLEKQHRNEPVNFPESKSSHLETPGPEKNSGQSTEKLECKIKLIKNPKKSTESSEASSSSQVLEKKEMEKPSSDAPKRHTVYFMYDRIEKDPSTGKKIFMGKFRTKDDLRILREHSVTSRNNSSKSFGSQGVKDKTSSVESRSIGMDDSGEFLQKKSATPERQKTKKQMSAHNFHPKCLELTQFKARNSNPVLAKVVNWFQYDGENFEVLAGIMGLDQKCKSKLFGEEKAGESAGESSFSAKDKSRRREACQDKATMCSCHSLTPENVPNSVGLKNADSDSVIIVPVEVESWSKIEVVLIEHSDDKQSIKTSKKYVPLL